MFLESKSHWPSALKEAARIIRKYLVLETYAVNHRGAISYTVDELLSLLDGWEVVRRNVRKDMQNLVLTPGRQ
jgi:tellurite methyltransferase